MKSVLLYHTRGAAIWQQKVVKRRERGRNFDFDFFVLCLEYFLSDVGYVRKKQRKDLCKNILSFSEHPFSCYNLLLTFQEALEDAI